MRFVGREAADQFKKSEYEIFVTLIDILTWMSVSSHGANIERLQSQRPRRQNQRHADEE